MNVLTHVLTIIVVSSILMSGCSATGGKELAGTGAIIISTKCIVMDTNYRLLHAGTPCVIELLNSICRLMFNAKVYAALCSWLLLLQHYAALCKRMIQQGG
jgi:hypothetical protein